MRSIRISLMAMIASSALMGVAIAGSKGGRAGVLAGPPPNVILNPAMPTTNQTSPSYARAGSNVVASWLNAFTTTRVHYGTSTDGGATFTAIGEVPTFSGYSWRNDGQVEANPNTGEFWLAGQMQILTPTRHRIAVVKGTFSGMTFTWGTPVFLTPDIPSSVFSGLVDLAIDPAGGNLYLAFDDRLTVPASPVLKIYRSTNGGATWDGPLPGVSYMAFARLAVGTTGDLIIVGLVPSANPLHSAYQCLRTINPGDPAPTWTTHSVDSDIANNRGWPAPGPSVNGFQRPWLAVDRTGGVNNGRLYTGWLQSPAIDQQPLPDTTNALLAALEVEPNDVSGTETPLTVGTVMRGAIATSVDPDRYKMLLNAGDCVIVSVDSAAASSGVGIQVFTPDLSQSLGSTFVSTLQSFPIMFCAPASGDYTLVISPGFGTTPYGYRLRTAFATAEPPAYDTRDVVLTRSDDGGQTWSSPVQVNDDSHYFDNGMPMIAVGADGCPYAAWRDFHDDTYGLKSHTYVSRSDDGGATWLPSTRITSGQTNWAAASSVLGYSFGDVIAAGPSVHLAWNDARDANGDVYSAAFLTDFDLSACTAGSMVEREDVVAIGATLTSHNPLFANDYNVTLTDERGWPMPSPGSVNAAASGTASPGLSVTVPDTAAAGINVVTLHVTTARGTLEQTCNVPLDVQAPTGVGDGTARFALEPSRPNPARGHADFAFHLPAAGRATLVVYGLRGEVVCTLLDGERAAGASTIRWDGRDASGRKAAPGAYYAKLTGGGRTALRRFVYLR